MASHDGRRSGFCKEPPLLGEISATISNSGRHTRDLRFYIFEACCDIQCTYQFI